MYRYLILGGAVVWQRWEWLREIARSKGMLICVCSNNQDHSNMLVGILSSLSITKMEQFLRGKGSHHNNLPAAQFNNSSGSTVHTMPDLSLLSKFWHRFKKAEKLLCSLRNDWY